MDLTKVLLKSFLNDHLTNSVNKNNSCAGPLYSGSAPWRHHPFSGPDRGQRAARRVPLGPHPSPAVGVEQEQVSDGHIADIAILTCLFCPLSCAFEMSSSTVSEE